MLRGYGIVYISKSLFAGAVSQPHNTGFSQTFAKTFLVTICKYQSFATRLAVNGYDRELLSFGIDHKAHDLTSSRMSRQAQLTAFQHAPTHFDSFWIRSIPNSYPSNTKWLGGES